MSCGRLSRAPDAWRVRFDAAHKGVNAIFVQPLSYNEGNKPILSFKRRKPMSLNVVYTEEDVCNFVEALSELTDARDNRGKHSAIAFVVEGVVVAILRE